MASFCLHCGAEVMGAFCGVCGRPVTAAQPVQAQPAPVPAAPVVPKKQGGGLTKLLLVVGGVVVLLGVLAIAGVLYGVYKATQAVTGMIEGENRTPVSNTAAFRGRACEMPPCYSPACGSRPQSFRLRLAWLCTPHTGRPR